MTIEEAKEYIPDFEAFCKKACNMCENKYCCPQRCKDLCKAEQIDFNRILNCYARHDGEMYKVFWWLRQVRV